MMTKQLHDTNARSVRVFCNIPEDEWPENAVPKTMRITSQDNSLPPLVRLDRG